MIEKFYREHKKKLTNMVRCKVGGNHALAEDVVQEAFVRAIRFYPSFDEERGPFGAWFNKILFNSLRDVQAQQKAVSGDVEANEFQLQNVLPMDDLVLPDDVRRDIQTHLSQVSNPDHRAVLYLFFILGYTGREICMIEENLTVTNVTTIVMRFKEQLKRNGSI